MGVKDLMKVVYVDDEGNKKVIADTGEPIEWATLTGKRVMSDTMNEVYAAFMAGGDPLAFTDSRGRPTKHIMVILRKVMKLRKYKTTQTWIFDSPIYHELKGETQAKRRETRKFNVTTEHINEIKELLTMCGVDYLVAPDGVDGEMYGAFLLRKGYADYMFSNDVDPLLIHGAIASKGVKKAKFAGILYSRDVILSATHLTVDELVSVALALGTDYNKKIPRIGPATVINRVKKGDIPWTDETEAARKLFDECLNDEEMCSKVPSVMKGALDLDKLRAFLEERDFNVDKYNIASLI